MKNRGMVKMDRRAIQRQLAVADLNMKEASAMIGHSDSFLYNKFRDGMIHRNDLAALCDMLGVSMVDFIDADIYKKQEANNA